MYVLQAIFPIIYVIGLLLWDNWDLCDNFSQNLSYFRWISNILLSVKNAFNYKSDCNL